MLMLMSAMLTIMMGCGASKSKADTSVQEPRESLAPTTLNFSGDSALSYAARQVAFGSRVPGTQAHRDCGQWLYDMMEASGASVSDQKATLTAFDGTPLPMRNIFARLNPDKEERILLLAHWDSRPWADNDPDPSKRKMPVTGANDGASGAALLIELARILSDSGCDAGVDFLLCDAEDWGTSGDDDSWAMGTRYFVENPPVEGYSPQYAILVDMVGAGNARFMREYFSEQAAPALADKVWSTAEALGYGDLFPNRLGSAVTDDHVELIKGGIPAIDIIDYREGEGFFPGWHTTSDTMENLSAETLEAVGRTLEAIILKQ